MSKTFRLPHEQRTTLKEYFQHPSPPDAVRAATGARGRQLLRSSEGEFFGIVGPNGSGKSTLLKIIAGIYRQDTGTVRVDGLLSPFIELGVGFNPELTARDNIRINGTLLGLSSPPARQSASTISSRSRSSSASSIRSSRTSRRACRCGSRTRSRSRSTSTSSCSTRCSQSATRASRSVLRDASPIPGGGQDDRPRHPRPRDGQAALQSRNAVVRGTNRGDRRT